MDLNNKADEAALELIKQLITLSAGVLALSAASIGTLPTVPRYFISFILISWAALVVSIFCGIKTISVIVKSRLDSNADWSEGTGKKFAKSCHYGFLTGIAGFAAFIFVSLVIFQPKKDDAITIRIDDPRLVDILKKITEHHNPPASVIVTPETKSTQPPKSN